MTRVSQALSIRLIYPAGVYDRKRAIHDMAKNEDIDVITGENAEDAASSTS